MRIIAPVLILALILVPIFGSCPAFAEPGFFRPDDLSLPAGVRKATASVFKIYTVGRDNEKNLDAITIEDPAVDSALDQATKFGFDQNLAAAQLKFCKRQRLQPCLIFPSGYAGSAFPVGDLQSVYSVLHNFSDITISQVRAWHLTSHEEIFNRISTLPIPLAMFNQEGEDVYDAHNNRASLELFHSNHRLLGGEMKSNMLLFRFSDLVRLHVEKPLKGKPLWPADKSTQVGDRVYAVGYPAATNDRQKNFAAPDSLGNSLYVTKGRTFNVKEYSRRTGIEFTPDGAVYFDRYFVFADCDGQHGMSGGPILNEKGQVVAIIATIDPDITITPSPIVCAGLKLLTDVEYLTFWSAFPN